jgi:WD40 repeat protein
VRSDCVTIGGCASVGLPLPFSELIIHPFEGFLEIAAPSSVDHCDETLLLLLLLLVGGALTLLTPFLYPPSHSSCSDDHQVTKFSPTVGGAEQALTLGEDAFPTAMDWFPGVNGGKKSGADFFALGTTDGKVRFINRGGRVDKTFDAHGGAICSLRWSPDGSALVTVGEDGSTKVWSKSGMLRSQLATGNVPVYSAAWSPESDAVVYTNAKQLTIKPLQPTAKVEQWKAHDGIILQVDWNPVNAKIVSGGEDRKYKVWDAFGQLLYVTLSPSPSLPPDSCPLPLPRI